MHRELKQEIKLLNKIKNQSKYMTFHHNNKNYTDIDLIIIVIKIFRINWTILQKNMNQRRGNTQEILKLNNCNKTIKEIRLS